MTVQDVALRHVEVAPLHEGAFDKVLNPLDGRDLFTRHCRLHMRQQRRSSSAETAGEEAAPAGALVSGAATFPSATSSKARRIASTILRPS